jgi:hypothetical protein
MQSIYLSIISFAFKILPLVARTIWGIKITITSPLDGEAVTHKREQ